MKRVSEAKRRSGLVAPIGRGNDGRIVELRLLVGYSLDHGAVLKSHVAPDRTAKPLVKWAGGKQWLAPFAPVLVPPHFSGRYYEPFVGGGALFFALRPRLATLSDKNRELIMTYRILRDNPERVISLLRTYPYNEEFYYRLRRKKPRSPLSFAARFLCLNRTCWNGLYRVNRRGEFNTPFGRFKNPTICDADRLRAAAKLLRRARLLIGDFENTVATAQQGDLVYFDPPYITGHTNNGFLRYNEGLFSWADQERLARAAIRLADRGVHVLVSNADHPGVICLYRGFHCFRIARRSLISGQSEHRRTVAEALLTSYPLAGVDSEDR